MKPSVLVAFLVLWLTAGCGKVGDPRPPSIRIPAKITDLNAKQSEHSVTLSWTNPSKYEDGSNATDLESVHILRNGTPIKSVMASGAGKPQSTVVDEQNVAGKAVYSIELETRRGRVSTESNLVSLEIVDVPGAVGGTHGFMDQGRIHLTWQPPIEKSSLADVYIVRRDDGGIPPTPVHETHYDDAAVEAGKTYRYVIIASHGEAQVPGPPSAAVVVVAKDETPPAAPTGLQPPVVSDSGAILSWDMNTETDLGGYLIYRSDSPNPRTFTSLDNEAIHTISSARDANYKPGTYYAVKAIDESGNSSELSAPVRAP